MSPMASRKLGETLSDSLLGLRYHIETGEEAGSELPQAANPPPSSP
jgi:hypothetical protein